jgi:hypothetical protein
MIIVRLVDPKNNREPVSFKTFQKSGWIEIYGVTHEIVMENTTRLLLHACHRKIRSKKNKIS